MADYVVGKQQFVSLLFLFLLVVSSTTEARQIVADIPNFTNFAKQTKAQVYSNNHVALDAKQFTTEAEERNFVQQTEGYKPFGVFGQYSPPSIPPPKTFQYPPTVQQQYGQNYRTAEAETTNNNKFYSFNQQGTLHEEEEEEEEEASKEEEVSPFTTAQQQYQHYKNAQKNGNTHVVATEEEDKVDVTNNPFKFNYPQQTKPTEQNSFYTSKFEAAAAAYEKEEEEEELSSPPPPVDDTKNYYQQQRNYYENYYNSKNQQHQQQQQQQQEHFNNYNNNFQTNSAAAEAFDKNQAKQPQSTYHPKLSSPPTPAVPVSGEDNIFEDDEALNKFLLANQQSYFNNKATNFQAEDENHNQQTPTSYTDADLNKFLANQDKEFDLEEDEGEEENKKTDNDTFANLNNEEKEQQKKMTKTFGGRMSSTKKKNPQFGFDAETNKYDKEDELFNNQQQQQQQGNAFFGFGYEPIPGTVGQYRQVTYNKNENVAGLYSNDP